MITLLNILGILHISLSCVSIICCHKMAVMDNYNVQLRRKPEGLEMIIWKVLKSANYFFLKVCSWSTPDYVI